MSDGDRLRYLLRKLKRWLQLRYEYVTLSDKNGEEIRAIEAEFASMYDEFVRETATTRLLNNER